MGDSWIRLPSCRVDSLYQLSWPGVNEARGMALEESQRCVICGTQSW